MTELTEGQHKAEFLVSEAEGTISREIVTVASGQNLKAGHVLGKITVGTATGVAASGNTGNGTLSAITLGAGAKAGTYNLTCVEPAANGGTFLLEDPDGATVGTAHVGTAFTGPLNFTLSDGTTDFVSGDRFLITVAAGSGKYKEYSPDSTNGSNIAVAILLDNIDATAADKEAVIIARHAEVNGAELIWWEGADDTTKAEGIVQLKLQTILVRPAI